MRIGGGREGVVGEEVRIVLADEAGGFVAAKELRATERMVISILVTMMNVGIIVRGKRHQPITGLPLRRIMMIGRGGVGSSLFETSFRHKR
jgi:hypothetical protein